MIRRGGAGRAWVGHILCRLVGPHGVVCRPSKRSKCQCGPGRLSSASLPPSPSASYLSCRSVVASLLLPASPVPRATFAPVCPPCRAQQLSPPQLPASPSSPRAAAHCDRTSAAREDVDEGAGELVSSSEQVSYKGREGYKELRGREGERVGRRGRESAGAENAAGGRYTPGWIRCRVHKTSNAVRARWEKGRAEEGKRHSSCRFTPPSILQREPPPSTSSMNRGPR